MALESIHPPPPLFALLLSGSGKQYRVAIVLKITILVLRTEAGCPIGGYKIIILIDGYEELLRFTMTNSG